MKTPSDLSGVLYEWAMRLSLQAASFLVLANKVKVEDRYPTPEEMLSLLETDPKAEESIRDFTSPR